MAGLQSFGDRLSTNAVWATTTAIFNRPEIMLSLGFLELLLFLEVAVAATTDSSSFPLRLSSNNTFASPSLRTPYGSTYICDPRNYEVANVESCENAANQVQGTRDRLKFAQRQSGVDGIAIPHNWVSSMSLCMLSAMMI